MNACSKYQKGLALLAAGVLKDAGRGELQSHVATCPGCRNYLHELSKISRQHSNLVDSLPSAELSVDWHGRLVQRMHALEPESRNGLTSQLRAAFRIWRWRLAIPSAIAVAVMLLVPFRPQTDPGTALPTPQQNLSAATKNTGSEFTPTLLAYQRALRQSPEALDALLSQEAAGSTRSAPLIMAISRNPGVLIE